MPKYEVTVCDNDGKLSEKIDLDNVDGPEVKGAQWAPLIIFQRSGSPAGTPPVAAFRYQAIRSIVIKEK
jgi:hypothetical protein